MSKGAKCLLSWAIVVMLPSATNAQSKPTSLFDGKTLTGWTSEPEGTDDCWEVIDGAIRGTGKEDKLVYLVYQDRDLADFRLSLKYRLKHGNTGIEVRAQPDESGRRPFIGYHADLGHAGIGDHILGAWDFHFAGRKEYSCKRGVQLDIDAEGGVTRAKVQDPFLPDDVEGECWNDVVIIADGNTLKFYINGKLSSQFTDNFEQGSLDSGAVGLQIHDAGMSVEFKDIVLERLD